jgi:hypothetical protein
VGNDTDLSHAPSRPGEETLSVGVPAARAPRRRGTGRQERIEETANSWQRDVQGQRAPQLEKGRWWRFDRVSGLQDFTSLVPSGRRLLGPERATHQPGTATAKRMDSMYRKVMDRMYCMYLEVKGPAVGPSDGNPHVPTRAPITPRQSDHARKILPPDRFPGLGSAAGRAWIA